MLFTIITPTFNSDSTIKRTIESILNQTNKDYEYLIIDGGSQDNTVEIIKQYEPLFQGRLRWLSEKDTGIYNAMNKGIKMANGKVIGIVNSDDWLEIDTLEIIKKTIINREIDVAKPIVITGEMRFHYLDGKSVVFKTSEKRYRHYAKVYRMGLNHPATFVSQSTYDQIGLFDENLQLFADADLFVRVYRNNVPVIFIDKILSNMSDGGASNIYSDKIKKDNTYILNKYCKSKLEYYWLLNQRKIISSMKRFSQGKFLTYLKKYRELRNN